LATLDPLAAIADTNQTMLHDLLAQVETENAAVQEFLQSLTQLQSDAQSYDCGSDFERPEVSIPEIFQILVSCQDEDEQREIFEQLTADGRSCRIVNL